MAIRTTAIATVITLTAAALGGCAPVQNPRISTTNSYYVPRPPTYAPYDQEYNPYCGVNGTCGSPTGQTDWRLIEHDSGY